MAATLIFFIVIIASKARLASPPPAASASDSARCDLPGEAPAVLAPTALAFRAVIADDRVPVSVRPIADDELMAYLDGELAVERAAGIATHLERCRECQAVAADLQTVSRRLLDWKIEESRPLLQHRITEALNTIGEPKVQTARKKSYLLARPWTWVASAALALILAVAVILRQTSPRSEPIVEYDRLALDSRAQHLEKLPQDTQEMLLQRATSGTSSGVVAGVPQAAAVPSPEQAIQTGRPLIVRAAEMSITTAEFDRTRPEITRIVNGHLGYIAQLAVNSPSDQGRNLIASLRVPAGQLDGVLLEMRKLGRIRSESQSGDEVTQQYIDLAARLKNARNAEDRLTEILRQRTGKLSDVLAVEEQIDRTQGEIEQMDAELKNLSGRIALATIQVQVLEEYRQPMRIDHGSTLGRLRNSAVEGCRRVINGAIAISVFLLAYGPGLLIFAVILLFPGRAIWKLVARRTRSEPHG